MATEVGTATTAGRAETTASRGRRFATKLCISLGLLAALLIAGETAAYLKLRPTLAEEIDPRAANPMYQGKAWAPRYWEEFRQANRARYHSYVLWRRGPYSGQMISIDDRGMRSTANSDCATGAFTIWIFGNSALWGTGSRDFETIPSQLAKLYHDNNRPVCVVNYGETGWVSTQEVVQLMLELKHSARRPNLVVFYDGVTDAFLRYQSDQADVDENYAEMKSLFENRGSEQRQPFLWLQKTYTYLALQKVGQKLRLQNEPATHRDTSESAAQIAADKTRTNYFGNIDMVAALARSYGFDYAFFIQPTVFVGQKQLTAEEQDTLRSEEKDHPGVGGVLRAAYRELKSHPLPHLFYLADCLDGRRDTLFLDFSHLGPEGNRLVAEEMYRNLAAAMKPLHGPGKR